MSKLNPQNATAYVGPGVLRKGGKITPVPNGPLIKKKGPYAGSTLKSGGKVKKGQEGVKIGNTTYTITNSTKDTIKGNPKYPGTRTPRTSMSNSKTDQGISSVKRLLKSKAKNGANTKKAMMGSSIFKDNPIYKKSTEARGMIGKLYGIPGKPIVKNGSAIKKAQNGKTTTTKTTKKPIPTAILPSMQTLPIKSKPYTDKQKDSLIDSWKKEIDSKFLKKKAGGMIKRADGSYSKRGLWDNIRANKGSGKKPTAEMLKQERKIKAKTKK
jgi:hypothetical protein